MIHYFKNYFGHLSVMSALCFLVCVVAVAHQVACLLRKRNNEYLVSAIVAMLALGLLDSIYRYMYVFSDVTCHFSGADLGRTDMEVITTALYNACYIPYTLFLALHATLICLGLNIIIKWRTRGSRVPSTKCRVP